MTPRDLGLMEMLLDISDRKSISEESRVIFMTLLSELLRSLQKANHGPYIKSYLMPLLQMRANLEAGEKNVDIKAFGNALIDTFNQWGASLLIEFDGHDFALNIQTLNLGIKIFSGAVSQELALVRENILDTINARLKGIVASKESLLIASRRLKIERNLPNLTKEEDLIRLEENYEKFAEALFYIETKSDLSIEDNDKFIEMKTRKAIQDLLLNDNSLPFTSLLNSGQARTSSGNCTALDVAFAYVEMALNRISEFQRDSLFKLDFSNIELNESLFTHARKTIPLASYTKKTPEILTAMQACIERKPDLNVFDKEFRLLCRQRIDHAMIQRRFSFKGRSKHFNYTDAAQSMRDLRQTLDAAKIDFFLMSGTLLGAVREKGFIASDYDIDIGIFDTQADIPKLSEICDKSDLFSIDEIVEDSIVKVKHISGIVIDLFIYFEVDGLQCHRGGVHEWYNGPFGLTEIDFLGGRYFIPDNYEEWLAENYGNWEKPVLFYDMSYDTPNRDYISSSTKGIYYLQKRISNALKKNWNNFISMGVQAMKREFSIDLTRYLPPSLRRKDKFEHPRTKIDPSQVSHVIVGLYDEVTQDLLEALNILSEDKITLAAVYGAQDVEAPSCVEFSSFIERCKMAGALVGVDSVIDVSNKNDIDNLSKVYKSAKITCLDGLGSFSLSRKKKKKTIS